MNNSIYIILCLYIIIKYITLKNNIKRYLPSIFFLFFSQKYFILIFNNRVFFFFFCHETLPANIRFYNNL